MKKSPRKGATTKRGAVTKRAAATKKTNANKTKNKTKTTKNKSKSNQQEKILIQNTPKAKATTADSASTSASASASSSLFHSNHVAQFDSNSSLQTTDDSNLFYDDDSSSSPFDNSSSPFDNSSSSFLTENGIPTNDYGSKLQDQIRSSEIEDADPSEFEEQLNQLLLEDYQRTMLGDSEANKKVSYGSQQEQKIRIRQQEWRTLALLEETIAYLERFAISLIQKNGISKQFATNAIHDYEEWLQTSEAKSYILNKLIKPYLFEQKTTKNHSLRYDVFMKSNLVQMDIITPAISTIRNASNDQLIVNLNLFVVSNAKSNRNAAIQKYFIQKASSLSDEQRSRVSAIQMIRTRQFEQSQQINHHQNTKTKRKTTTKDTARIAAWLHSFAIGKAIDDSRARTIAETIWKALYLKFYS
jgi:hypothetical protein